jgi:hypothetical protein
MSEATHRAYSRLLYVDLESELKSVEVPTLVCGWEPSPVPMPLQQRVAARLLRRQHRRRRSAVGGLPA